MSSCYELIILLRQSTLNWDQKGQFFLSWPLNKSLSIYFAVADTVSGCLT